MKKIITFCFIILASLIFSKGVYADILSYTPSSTGISYGYGSALSRINDGNISTSGSNDYQVHPTNAIGKTITMTFNDPIVITDAVFYNRIGCCSNRIGNAQMIFKDVLGTVLYTYTFASGNNPAVVTITDPSGDISGVKTVELTNFQINSQNFREIVFNGNVISPTTLRITEVEYDAVQGGNDGTREWIELYNYGTVDINLENWTLTDANPTTVVLPNLNILAGAQVVLANNPTNFQVNYPTITADVDLSPTLGLSNNGDTITLRDPNGNDIDFVGWEGASLGWDLATGPDAGESICRIDKDIDTDASGDFMVCSIPSPQSDDVVAPITPISPPDLTTDTGNDSNDNITSNITPSFDTVCTEINSTITLYEDATVLGTASCASTGIVSIISSISFSNGTHNITYTETDQFDNESILSPALTLVIDDIAPAVNMFSADTDGSFSIDSPNLEFNATDIGGSGIFQYEISIDGGAYSAQISPYNPTIPAAAAHAVIVRVTDVAGNQSTSTIQFPPVVTINSPTISSNTIITDSTISITGPNDITTVMVSANASNLNCGILPQATPLSCTFQVDTSGTVTVNAEDTSGATGTSTREYIIDDISPIISFDNNTEVGPVASDTVIVNVSEINFMTLYDYGFSPDAVCDGSDIFTETFASRENLVFENEDNNGNYICIRATDTFGNTSYLASTHPLNIDITPPMSPIVNQPTENPITGTGTAGDVITMITDSGSTCVTNVQLDNTWSCVLSPDPISGENYATTATDVLGNISIPTEGNIFLPPASSTKRGSRIRTQKELDEIFGESYEDNTRDIQNQISELQKELNELLSEEVRCSIDYSRLIKRGMIGEDVRQVQICMNSLGYTSGPEDSIYGPLTYKGITSYQQDKNLMYIDGIVGPETSSSLNALSNVTVNKIELYL